MRIWARQSLYYLLISRQGAHKSPLLPGRLELVERRKMFRETACDNLCGCLQKSEESQSSESGGTSGYQSPKMGAETQAGFIMISIHYKSLNHLPITLI